MPTATTTGLINASKPKPPKPNASPKSFTWTSPSTATDEDRQKFAATLQELLPSREWTHASLAEQLWGRDNNTARNIGKARDWVRGVGRFPSELEAGYVAQVLDVSMQRLVQPEKPFDPTAGGLVRPMRARKEWKTGGKVKGKAKANGHDPDSDTRWLRPKGVDPTFVKFETSKKHPTLVYLELKGEMPPEVAMAILAMSGSRQAE